MSDFGRKDLSTKVEDKSTPDTSKSTLDKAGDHITGGADHVARDTVPDSKKSATQAATDKVERTKDAHTSDSTHSDKSVGDKIKETLHMDKK